MTTDAKRRKSECAKIAMPNKDGVLGILWTQCEGTVVVKQEEPLSDSKGSNENQANVCWNCGKIVTDAQRWHQRNKPSESKPDPPPEAAREQISRKKPLLRRTSLFAFHDIICATLLNRIVSAATPVCAATSLCAFARLPLEIWQQLVRFLSYSDVAACACSTGHEDTKRLLIRYMRLGCCVSTFKRLNLNLKAEVRNPRMLFNTEL